MRGERIPGERVPRAAIKFDSTNLQMASLATSYDLAQPQLIDREVEYTILEVHCHAAFRAIAFLPLACSRLPLHQSRARDYRKRPAYICAVKSLQKC